jgi:hypothetical protein
MFTSVTSRIISDTCSGEAQTSRLPNQICHDDRQKAVLLLQEDGFLSDVENLDKKG